MVVAVLDIAKAALPAAGFGALDHRAGLVAGVAAVLGHVSSPFLRGRGGRGVATAAGAVVGSHPLWAPVVLAVWALVWVGSRRVSLASVSAAASVTLVALVARTDLLWAAVLTLVVLVRHLPNLARWQARGRPPLGDPGTG